MPDPSPTRSSAADVELRDVVKSFGDVAAVDHVDLVVPAGEFLALLGPSGCGKTTTLRIIAGFEQPTAGEVLVAGRSMLGVPPHKREVNTVFQHYALFPHMRVLDNVAYGLKQRGVAKAERERQAADALAMVRMEGFERRRPAEMSGGQQQRVALARALVMRPACCSSTSRSAPWTSSCAARCRWSSRASRTRSASRSSSSPTTRRRRWRSPTGSR
jgi:spermidine/putrescine transport system ATP-binding protein